MTYWVGFLPQEDFRVKELQGKEKRGKTKPLTCQERPINRLTDLNGATCVTGFLKSPA